MRDMIRSCKDRQRQAPYIRKSPLPVRVVDSPDFFLCSSFRRRSSSFFRSCFRRRSSGLLRGWGCRLFRGRRSSLLRDGSGHSFRFSIGFVGHADGALPLGPARGATCPSVKHEGHNFITVSVLIENDARQPISYRMCMTPCPGNRCDEKAEAKAMPAKQAMVRRMALVESFRLRLMSRYFRSYTLSLPRTVQSLSSYLTSRVGPQIQISQISRPGSQIRKFRSKALVPIGYK